VPVPTIDIENVRQLPALHSEVIPGDYIDNLGHMNMNRYYDVIARGAWLMLQKFGYGEHAREELHAGSFVLMHVMRYLREVLEGETVTVYGRVIGRTEKKVHVMYFVVNDTRENVAATQESLNIHADLAKRASAPLTEDIAKNIDALIAQHSALAWACPVSGAIEL